MPTIDVPIQQGVGPLVACFVGVSIPRRIILAETGQPIPSPVRGVFLIDTGASGCCVDPELLKDLALPPIGRVGISTPTTAGQPHYCDQYDVSLFIPGNTAAGHLVEAIPVITTHLKSQGIDGLIGRDVLDNCTLIYNGGLKICTLAY